MPVFSRPHSKPNALSDSASSRDGGSPARPGWMLLGPDVNQAVEKRPGRDDERSARVRVAVLEREPDDAAVLDEDAARPPDQPLDVRLRVERALAPIDRTRCLSACARGDHTAGPRLRLSSLN